MLKDFKFLSYMLQNKYISVRVVVLIMFLLVFISSQRTSYHLN